MQVTQTTARHHAVYTMLALAVLAVGIVPVGGAVFVLGFLHGDSPCVMCWEQRIGMALIALIGLFVLRFGARPKYVGLSVLVGAWGIFMGLRHVGMHAARDIGQGFSAEILGAHTYTWSLFIFWICIVTMGLLLMGLRRNDDAPARPRALGPLDRAAMLVFLVVIAGNAVQAFASTGPPPFMGQGDPVRFSFNPRHWVWSLEEWSNLLSFDRWSLRGRWAAEKPSLEGLSANPAGGPFGNVPVLAVQAQRTLALPLRGTVTDIAYDPAGDRFLLTTQHGVYLLDGDLQRLVRYTVVDPGYSVDLGDFAGAAFLGGKDLMAAGENKSYVVLRADDGADADRNFRYFLESYGSFTEMSRSRFGTVRARMMYTMSLAFDPDRGSLYTVTVPNANSKRLIVSRFDARDLTLSEEFAPSLAAGGPALRPKRSLAEYYVTGATVENGRMHAISAAFSTLLTIDLATHEIVAARAIQGLDRPTGIALKKGAFYIACEDGRIVTVPRDGSW